MNVSVIKSLNFQTKITNKKTQENSLGFFCNVVQWQTTTNQPLKRMK